MDWKIFVGVLLFLIGFAVFRQCSGEDEKSYDQLLAERQAAAQREKAAQEEAERRRTALEARKRAARHMADRPVETIRLETAHIRATLTTLGAALTAFELRDPQYTEAPRDWSTGKRDLDADPVPVNLVTTNPNPRFASLYPMRMVFHDGLAELLPEGVWEVADKTKTSVTFRYTQPGTDAVLYKKFALPASDNPYEMWLTVRVVNRGSAPLSFRPAVLMTGYQPASEASSGLFSPQPNLQVALCHAQDDLFREPWEEIDAPYTARNVAYAGVGNNYFLMAAVPRSDLPTACRVTALTKNSASPQPVLQVELGYGTVTVDPGRDVQLRYQTYLGPKKLELLRKVDPTLDTAIDYGWFAPISKVLLWILFFFQKYVSNWGVAIILLTVTVKLALIPLTNKSFKSSNAMKALKPEIDKINAKYKDDPQEKQKAIMALYKQRGINPLGGCLPMLLQMPIWFALFSTLRTSPELYHAPFFGWIRDLSSADPYFITPVVMGLLMFVQQRMMPMGADNAQMKMMLYIMPIMFTAMMIFLPSGLTLYILVNTVLSIAHQWILKIQSERAASA